MNHVQSLPRLTAVSTLSCIGTWLATASEAVEGHSWLLDCMLTGISHLHQNNTIRQV